MSHSKKKQSFQNRRASYDYELLDRVVCGIVLTGTEVKTLRSGQCTLEGAWVKVENDEVWLVQCDIPEYTFGTHSNHAPKRDRKLLMRRQEIQKIAKKSLQKGFTLVPTFLFFNDRGKVKLEIAVARGKQTHDKRESIKKADLKRQMAKE